MLTRVGRVTAFPAQHIESCDPASAPATPSHSLRAAPQTAGKKTSFTTEATEDTEEKLTGKK